MKTRGQSFKQQPKHSPRFKDFQFEVAYKIEYIYDLKFCFKISKFESVVFNRILRCPK